jgi:hypothetical protein
MLFVPLAPKRKAADGVLVPFGIPEHPRDGAVPDKRTGGPDVGEEGEAVVSGRCRWRVLRRCHQLWRDTVQQPTVERDVLPDRRV